MLEGGVKLKIRSSIEGRYISVESKARGGENWPLGAHVKAEKKMVRVAGH